MAREADLVFARDRLRTLRGQVRISTLRFDDFNGAVEVIARRLEENRTRLVRVIARVRLRVMSETLVRRSSAHDRSYAHEEWD